MRTSNSSFGKFFCLVDWSSCKREGVRHREGYAVNYGGYNLPGMDTIRRISPRGLLSQGYNQEDTGYNVWYQYRIWRVFGA